MLIKIKPNNNIKREIYSFFKKSKNRNYYIPIFFMIILIIVGVGGIYYGMLLHKTGAAYTMNRMVKAKAKIIPNYIKGMFADPKRLTIDIKHEDYQKILYQREKSLALNSVVSGPDDYVPATLKYKDSIVEAKLRLKGDLVTHLEGEKWSYRIVIKGDKTLFGMKVFSIQRPRERNYINEWILQEAMRREDIIALRYDFINVTINGKNYGIYGLEEHFEKRLIEYNRRREGPIVCFGEGSPSEDGPHWGKSLDARFSKQADFYQSKIDLYRPGKTLTNPSLRDQFLTANYLLESFRNETLRTSEVFDYKRLARYYAILDLFNGRHAAKYGNLKFYYNPISSKLEPICFDAEFVGLDDIYGDGIHAENWFNDFYNPAYIFFKDNLFFSEYIRELNRISQPAYLDTLFDKIENNLTRNLSNIYSSYPYADFSKSSFYSKQSYIHKVLTIPRSINVYFNGHSYDRSDAYFELNISNFGSMPVKIHSTIDGNGTMFIPKDNNTIIDSRLPHSPLETRKVQFILPDSSTINIDKLELDVNYSIFGLNEILTEEVTPWTNNNEEMKNNDLLREKPNIDDFTFLSVDEMNRRISFKQGDWILDRDVIFPEGYRVFCGKGTNLDLRQSAMILSYSAFEFFGTAEEPITISSSDSSGKGIAIFNTKDKSILQHVIFDNLSNPTSGSWSLSGAVNIYQSSIDITACTFANSKCEDALNIIQSTFHIKGSQFNVSAFDAFDSDYSNGTIEFTSFYQSGNDAVDVSGSSIELDNITIINSGDKGLSAGEKSKVIFDNMLIDNANIAIASKDLSQVIGNKLDISNCNYGLAVYQKKSEYGPSEIIITNLETKDIKIPYHNEPEGKMLIDNLVILETVNISFPKLY
jgi:hypothetical protein